MFNVDFPLSVHVHIFILHVFSFFFFLFFFLSGVSTWYLALYAGIFWFPSGRRQGKSHWGLYFTGHYFVHDAFHWIDYKSSCSMCTLWHFFCSLTVVPLIIPQLSPPALTWYNFQMGTTSKFDRYPITHNVSVALGCLTPQQDGWNDGSLVSHLICIMKHSSCF